VLVSDHAAKRPFGHTVVLGAFGFEAKSGKQVLEAKSFMAVTATGGAGVFRAQWAEEFMSIIPITTM
jgi:hypothetical protein